MRAADAAASTTVKSPNAQGGVALAPMTEDFAFSVLSPPAAELPLPLPLPLALALLEFLVVGSGPGGEDEFIS